MKNIKDLKKELLSSYPFRIEMHTHTSPVSECSRAAPADVVSAYAALGYDAVVITNHFLYELFRDMSKSEAVSFYMKDYEEACAAGEKQGIKVILGAEVRFTECSNDYLLYGVDRKGLSAVGDLLPLGIENFRKRFDLSNSVFLQAHPFRDGMQKVDPDLLDGIEVFNMHPGHNSRIALAARYAGEQNFKISIAGSDFHYPNQNHEGISALRTRVLPEDSFELVRILKSGDYILEIGGQAIVI